MVFVYPPMTKVPQCVHQLLRRIPDTWPEAPIEVDVQVRRGPLAGQLQHHAELVRQEKRSEGGGGAAQASLPS